MTLRINVIEVEIFLLQSHYAICLEYKNEWDVIGFMQSNAFLLD
jgi:hypothetical protein